MTLRFCAREEEVAAAVREGRWPQACDPALRAHVESCHDCGDVVLVAQTLQQARAVAPPARLDSPGVIWWRAQVRRRNRALERVTQPIALAEKLGWISTLLAVIGLAVWQRGPLAVWMRWLADVPRSSAFQWAGLADASASAGGWPLVLLFAGLGTLALFALLAVYLVAQKE